VLSLAAVEGADYEVFSHFKDLDQPKVSDLLLDFADLLVREECLQVFAQGLCRFKADIMPERLEHQLEGGLLLVAGEFVRPENCTTLHK